MGGDGCEVRGGHFHGHGHGHGGVLLAHLHQRLAVALGVGAAEVAGGPLGQVLPLLVADEHDLLVAQVGEAGDDRLVVADGAVAVQLDELVEDQLDVVAGLRALLVARDLDGLPGVEVGVDRPLQVRQLAAEAADLLGEAGESPPARFLA